MQDKVIKLTVDDERCPICEGELEKKMAASIRFAICKNRCYAYEVFTYYTEVAFFLEEWLKTNIVDREIIITDEIREEIDYWKEDYRYLAKILEES